jgi:uncharacterized protein (TIGR03118 family)
MGSNPLNRALVMTASPFATGLFAASALGLLLAANSAGAATEFNVTNLVSDGTVPAVTIDPSLINPWGVSFGPTSPFWVSDNGAGVSTLYTGAGAKLGLTVTIPPPAGGAPPAAPTGQVFNSTGSFTINGTRPLFLFDTEDGTIAGWAGSFGTTAQLAPTPQVDAVYKGLAIASDGAGDHLYASDFHNGDIQMFTNGFAAAPTTFTDPTVAAGYAPFNVQTLNGELYVTFALQDADRHDDVAGAGHGYVDVFNLDGTFNRRIVSLGGEINSPWGLAIAPSSFGDFAGDLLVGNFGDGTISAFNDVTGTFEGRLLGRDGNPLQFGDLWALTPGNGVTGSLQDIYFTAGLSDEAHGLFGSLSVAPEPQTWWLAILGFALTGAALRRQPSWRRGLQAASDR